MAYLTKMAVRAHILVSGRVQGVFYRQSTKNKAVALGLCGWVKNIEDGMVEAVFEGEQECVKSMVRWAEKGPEGSLVEDLSVRWNEPPEGFKEFSIRF
jgi:acylphosphatase